MKILYKNNSIAIGVLQIFFTAILSQLVIVNSSYIKKDKHHNIIPITAIKSRGSKFDGESKRLMLTSLIKNGKIREAKEAAKVKSPPFADVLSYSGFITVNKTTNSNLFFWFFPAKNEAKNVPIMLWLEGGPGFSVMYSIFAEHGPFFVESNGALKHKEFSWTNSHSMIYVDNPVGTGFSFTGTNSGYATNQEDVSRDLFEFLEQFSILFPEYSKNEWYIGGNSYAGKYIPPLALKIHNENKEKETNSKLNLKGIYLGAPFSDPMSVIEGHSEYFYYLGIIDENEKKVVDQQTAILKALIRRNDFPQAFMLQDAIFKGDFSPYSSLLTNYSGFHHFSNIFYPQLNSSTPDYVVFLNQENIQKAIHAGRVKYQSHSTIVPTYLIQDIFKPTKPVIEKILDLNYKVLIAVGQFDLYIPHTTLFNQIKSMVWKGKKAFLDDTNKKKLWKVDGDLAGYVRKWENMAYVIIRNAGHNSPTDQPKWCMDLIRRFIHGFRL